MMMQQERKLRSSRVRKLMSGLADAQLAPDQGAEAQDEEERARVCTRPERIAEPIPFLAFAEHDFPADHGDAEEAEAEGVERRGAAARRLDALLLEVVRVVDDGVAEDEREEADGDVEVEDPAPAIVVGDIAAEGGADDGGEEGGDAEERSWRRPVFRAGTRRAGCPGWRAAGRRRRGPAGRGRR